MKKAEESKYFWSRQYGRDLSGEETRQIASNLTGFFGLIKRWDDQVNVKEDDTDEDKPRIYLK